MKYAVESDGSLRIINLNEMELKNIHDSIEDFRKEDADAPQMAEKLIADIEKRKLKFDTLSQFSKWCHTAVRYTKPMVWARIICDFLFGEDELIPRLCDHWDTIHLSFVEKYKNFLIMLMKKGIISNTESKDWIEVFCQDENGVLRNVKFILIQSS
jgi:hypothetical protein